MERDFSSQLSKQNSYLFYYKRLCRNTLEESENCATVKIIAFLCLKARIYESYTIFGFLECKNKIFLHFEIFLVQNH